MTDKVSDERLEYLSKNAVFEVDRVIAADLLSTRAALSALQEQVRWVPDDYDAGVLNDYGGGNVGWWQDYICSEVNRCNGFWREQWENSLPTPPEEK